MLTVGAVSYPQLLHVLQTESHFAVALSGALLRGSLLRVSLPCLVDMLTC